MSGTLPPLFVITDEDHGGYVCVVLYTFLILTVLLVIIRVFTRWYVVKVIKPDDVLISAAALLAILEGVFVQLAVNHGLGKVKIIVTDSDYHLFQKYEYIAQILVVAAMACAKLSLALLVESLMAERYSLVASRGLLALIFGWTISSIFALAFQCSLPQPWDSSFGHCVNRGALRDVIAVLNVLTDLALILIPSAVLWRLRVSRIKRYSIVGLLATRLFVCISTAIQLYYSRFSLDTWSSVKSTSWNQIMMSLSIATAAIPSLGRVFVELQPTLATFAITQNHGVSANDKYIFSSFAGRVPRSYAVNNRLGVHTSVHGTRPISHNSDGGESTEGLREDGIRQNVIQQTVDFSVDIERHRSSNGSSFFFEELL